MKQWAIGVLLVLSGYLLLHDQLTYQLLLSSSDHGRDLYVFEATMEGQVPYKDYWWIYGPLMPYYYSVFFKLFGIDIASVLFGQFLLNLAAGIFFFSILSLFTSSILAYTATLWFWTFKSNFFFTYNHAAGIVCLLAVSYYILDYFRNKNLISLYIALLASFTLSLIKINFGVTSLVVLIPFTYIADRFNKMPVTRGKKYFYLASLAGMPLAVFSVYWSLLKTLPLYAIRQCLPYLPSDHPRNATFLTTAWTWWKTIAFNINLNWPNRLFAALLILCVFQTLICLFKNRTENANNKGVIFAILLFLSSYFWNMHEYFVSGVLYRTFWAQPFSLLLVFLFIGLAVKNLPKKLEILLILGLLIVIFDKFNTETKHVRYLRDRNQNLGIDRARIVAMNSNAWKTTVARATAFLKANLSPEESFLALPYEPLYYYLTDKKSPTRQLIFLEYINIVEEQERQIIAEIESNRTNWVVISNRSVLPGGGMGIFGQTYCPLLAQYLREHFEPVAEFGNWTGTPGWAWNHGVKILKRK